MVSAINTALAGLATASKRVETAAQKIAEPVKQLDNGSTDGGVNAEDIVDLSVGAQAFKANLNVIKVADKIEQSLLDILA